MAGKIYIVEGRQFKSDAEYKQALKDQETIEELREKIKSADLAQLKAISQSIEKGKYRFGTILGDDFVDELDDAIKNKQRSPEKEKPKRRLAEEGPKSRNAEDDAEDRSRRRSASEDMEDKPRRRGSVEDIEDRTNEVGKASRRNARNSERISNEMTDEDIEAEARRILKRREVRRRVILILSVGIGVLSIAVFTFFTVTNSTMFSKNSSLYQLREKAEQERGNSRVQDNVDDDVIIHYTETNTEVPDILPEFQEMLSINSKLIGWLTIDGTNIDYPVAQTSDNEYYLNHDLYQNYDRNGTIFLDCNCDVLKPSTNLILYGHHMQSGKMFGNLVKYADESYYNKHKYITFDTIYERGTYEVMYVFRSHVFEETEIAFKYYQFYDAYSDVEFASYMQEMSDMSLYDTGVTAVYGDRLLTLSTCDYQEANGRFVVVAKKID